MSESLSAARLEAIWTDVNNHRRLTRELTAFELTLETAGGHTLLGHGADGLRRILFPLGPGGPCITDRRSAGVQIGERELVDGAVTRRFVEVVCRRPRLNDLFASFGSELLQSLVDNPARPDERARSVLNRWRNLLAGETSRGLERNEVTGLLGELIIFEQIALAGRTDCDIWTGPDLSRHDFVGPNGSLEVKSTLAQSGWKIEIHGLGQLEEPPSGSLGVICVRLERSPEGDRSLGSQIDRLIDTGVDELDLWSKLNELGLYQESLEQTDRFRFNLKETAGFSVTDDFPRITPAQLVSGSLPAAISDVRYTVDLVGQNTIELQVAIERILAAGGQQSR